MSQTDFDTTERVFAFPVSELARLPELVASYGAELPDTLLKPGSPTTRCIAGGKDQSEPPLVLRSLKHPTTASALPLTDGRYAASGYWTNAILAAVAAGDVTGEEITPEELTALRPDTTI